MRLRWAAPSRKAAGARKQAFALPACAVQIAWPRISCTPRAALAFAITVATGSLGQVIDANTIESQNMERSRNSIGETLERFPITWNHVIEKESLKFKEMEHAGIE